MKAIRVHEFGGPQVLALEEVPDVQPGAHQLLVRLHAAGVNPVDTYIRAGNYGRLPPLPFIPGSDGAGIVEAFGADVHGVKTGDRVYVLKPGGTSLPGTYAERTLCDMPHVHPLPANVSFEQGAAIGVGYATAYRALIQRAQARPAETVLVHGASGGVGLAAVQLASSRGMTVIGTAGGPRGLELVRNEGAHFALNHNQADFVDRVMEFTAGRGVDVVLEMLANVNLAKDLSLLAMSGRVVVVGNRGTIEINPRDAMSRDAAIYGMLLWNAPAVEMQAVHAALVAGFANGTLRPIVGRRFPLADAAKAHEAVMQPGAHGKIVLTM
ncbi:MAG: NADPH:quinone reductase [Bacteroidales bacterium]